MSVFAGAISIPVNCDGLYATDRDATENALELKLCASRLVKDVGAAVSLAKKLLRERPPTLTEVIANLDCVISQSHDEHPGIELSALIVKCFLCGLPIPTLQRVFQVYCLLAAADGITERGRILLQFLKARVIAISVSAHHTHNLQWFVERTVAKINAPSSPFQSLSEQANAVGRISCINPMCLSMIPAYSRCKFKYHRKRRIRRHMYTLLDFNLTPRQATVEPHPKFGDVPTILCPTCAKSFDAVYTTRQLPLGFKFCLSCRAFHSLHHFIEDPLKHRIEPPIELPGHGVFPRIKRSCLASRREYGDFYWSANAAPLPKRITQRSRTKPNLAVQRASDATTCIGPYSDSRHRNTDVDRFLCTDGRLWNQSFETASGSQSQIPSLISSTTEAHTKVQKLAMKAVRHELRAQSRDKMDTVCSANLSSVSALGKLLHSYVSVALDTIKSQNKSPQISTIQAQFFPIHERTRRASERHIDLPPSRYTVQSHQDTGLSLQAPLCRWATLPANKAVVEEMKLRILQNHSK